MKSTPRQKQILIGVGLGILAAGLYLFWDRVLPALVETQLNRIIAHPEWPVGEEARTLHESVAVADLHADPLLWKRDWLLRGERGHTDLPRLKEGGVTLQVLTAVTKTPRGQNYERNSADSDLLRMLTVAQLWPTETWNSPYARARHQARKLADWDERAGQDFRIIRTRRDLEVLLADRAAGQRPVGGLFGIEGAHALEGDLAHLDELDALGLRVVGLTHFFDNRVAGSLHGESGEGLTDFGRQLVLEAGRRGMIIDVAHASPRAVRDVLEISERPVLLSHGGFQGTCDSGRNFDDDLMRELADHGALIGVGFWDAAVCDTSPRGIVEAMLYGIELMGVEHIALGSDFDGATEVPFDASELPILTQTMLDAGLQEPDIRKILGENVTDFFLQNLPEESRQDGTPPLSRALR